MQKQKAPINMLSCSKALKTQQIAIKTMQKKLVGFLNATAL